MTKEHLNNILFVHVHKEETDKPDLTEVACLFASANARRIDCFGKFALCIYMPKLMTCLRMPFFI